MPLNGRLPAITEMVCTSTGTQGYTVHRNGTRDGTSLVHERHEEMYLKCAKIVQRMHRTVWMIMEFVKT